LLARTPGALRTRLKTLGELDDRETRWARKDDVLMPRAGALLSILVALLILGDAAGQAQERGAKSEFWSFRTPTPASCPRGEAR